MPEKAGLQNYRVGIVLATYNCDRAHFAEQIKSIQQQTFQNWICLVTDDGSADEIKQFIQTLLEEDKRFMLHIQPQNLGSYHNFEYGIRYFGQDDSITHVAFSDQDDVWQPDKLSRLLEALETSGALLAHSDLTLIDEQGSLLHPSVWKYEHRHPEKLTPQLLLLRNTVTGCTVMIRRCLITDILPFPKQGQTSDWYHDHWMALVATHRGKIAHIREPLVQYRKHSNNVVGAEKQAGTIAKELELWLAKKGRLTLKSYRIHRDLSGAFFQRFYLDVEHDKLNPFSEKRFDFGWAILLLGLRSVLTGYGSQGITLRLWINKFVFDLMRTKTVFSKFLLGMPAK
jgi:glycosyltransferase involved in cell wall biosynthesis